MLLSSAYGWGGPVVARRRNPSPCAGFVERGDYAAGAEKLEAFQREHTSDARVEDAAYMAILALSRAGRRDDARAATKRYLADYPNGYRRAEVQALSH
jgi:outer membrane protein assembly factor BamD (BamD/ComL family)